MSTLAFDTHTFVKRLTGAGMPENQAEILAEEQARLVNEQLVTKEYLDSRLLQMEQRLTIRLGGMIVVGIGILLAAKFFS